MRRLIVCCAILVCLLLASSCGSTGQPSSEQQPSVTVKPPSLPESGAVTVFKLLPTGGPNGVLALKSVHYGTVKTLGSLHFRDMRKVGTVTIRVSSGKLDVTWNVDGQQISLRNGPVAFPPHTVASGIGWSNCTVGPADDETDFWALDRYFHHQPSQSSGPNIGGAFSIVVSESNLKPGRIFYCLTIAVTGKTQPSK